MGVGEGHGASQFASPLNMFSGPALMAKITGIPIPSPVKSSKRNRDEDEQHSSPSKRSRDDDEVGRDYDNQIQMMFDNLNNSDIEHGRNISASAPNDHPSSALMPWNRSNSHHSHQKLLSSRGPGSVLGSVGRRLTSPLIGRGSAMPGDLEQFNLQHEEDRIMYGRDDDDDDMPGSQPFYGGFPSSSRAEPLVDDSQFEQFGPGAEVDTQTAGQSQWVAQALDKESNNFFGYVQNTIMEREEDELSFDENQVAKEAHKSVGFGELFPEATSSAVVAAQAFYHVLTLATRNQLLVKQLVAVQDTDICGEIEIRVRELF